VFVVCDTNVFVRETHLLRKKGGPQLIRLLRAVKGRLVVPDVLQQEYIEQTRLAAAEEHSRIRGSLSALQTLTGGAGALALLDDPGVDRRTLTRLEALKPLVHAVPQTVDLLAAAGMRSLAKKRPVSKTDHGYKDCLIWESVLSLPSGSEVRLVSKDLRAFYEDERFAPDLEEEAKARGLRVRGVKDLGQVIQELEASNPSLDFAALSAYDLVESGSEAPARDSAPAPTDGSPPRAATREGPNQESTQHEPDLVASRLAAALEAMRQEEQRVLGYIAFFGDASKSQLFDALAQSALSPALAQNIAERLSLVGLVQDTGHHYIVHDRELAEAAASLVEADIIAILGRNR
jgi:PIN domain